MERRFEVPAGVALPELSTVDGVAAVTTTRYVELEATYFDTIDLRLAARQITLRRRTGGEDPGWRLRIPLGRERRTEIRLPLDRIRARVPEPIVGEIRAVVRTAELRPVAVVRTRRAERRILGDGGDVLAVLADDTLYAGPAGTGPTGDSWQEVVLAGGTDGAVLASLSARLEAAGLIRPSRTSLLQRALGDRVPASADPVTGDRLAAGDVVLAHLHDQIDTLVRNDPGARRGEPVAVHRMRGATKRLRATLATFRPILDRTRTEPLRGELRWLGQRLAGPQVVRRLADRLHRLAQEHDEAVRAGVDRDLGAQYRKAQDELVAALDGERYLALLDGLDGLVADPALTGRADQPADRVLPVLVDRAGRRFAASIAAADRAGAPDERERLLDGVRRAARRARYAAECLVTVSGRPAARLARRMHAAQRALSGYRDRRALREALRAMAIRAPGEAFTLGVLYGVATAPVPAHPLRMASAAPRAATVDT
jgi:CHAD domain-containing protein